MEKRLYRSNNKIIAGVCAGIAEYLEIDPTLVRILWALTTIFMGAGVLAYIICAIVIPPNPYSSAASVPSSGESGEFSSEDTEHAPSVPRKKSEDASLMAGLVLIIIGGLFLARKFFHWLDMGLVWAALLVILGLYLILKSPNKR